jgi:hypothetical protein
MAVRVERNGSTIKLFLKELSGSGGYEPGELIESKQIVLDQGEWCQFIVDAGTDETTGISLSKGSTLASMARAGFWKAVSEGRYHAVDRFLTR